MLHGVACQGVSRTKASGGMSEYLGADYLELLQCYFNHHRYERSAVASRVGKSPAELLTGEPHPHWLSLLGYPPQKIA